LLGLDCTSRAPILDMTDFLRRPRVLAVIGALVAVALLVVLLTIGGSEPANRQAHPAPAAPNPAIPAGTATSTPPARSSAVSPHPSVLRPLPRTTSADVYATDIALALWSVDYPSTSRAQVIAFWRGELADTLPAGTPAGTTLGQAQDAALSALDSRLPTAATWLNLAAARTRSAFTVTAVSEPATWISAVANGTITDPGLTARTVIGVQALTYGPPGSRHTSMQSQQLTVVLLCPPTTDACRLEIIPPDNTEAGG
jgi:hypothetical protein